MGGMIGGGMMMGGMMQQPSPMMGGPAMGQPPQVALGFDLLGGGFTGVQRPVVAPSQPLAGFGAPPQPFAGPGGPPQPSGGLGTFDFLGLQSGISSGASGNFYVAPKTVSVCVCVCVVCVCVCVCVCPL